MEMDSIGVHAPIKDELGLGPYEPPTQELEGEITTDEETELPGTRRPRKGEGWWGRGPPVRPIRKGIPRESVDGGGLCSPGRWPIDKRILPDDYTSKHLQKALTDSLQEALALIKKSDPTMNIKTLQICLALDKFKSASFDTVVIDKVRTYLRIICKQAGHGDGLPREGDVVQLFEVRLIQALLSAFQDPDHYYCTWWACGTWLGSKQRKLPRTPAVFDRKLKWRLIEPVDERHHAWQSNYPRWRSTWSWCSSSSVLRRRRAS